MSASILDGLSVPGDRCSIKVVVVRVVGARFFGAQYPIRTDDPLRVKLLEKIEATRF